MKDLLYDADIAKRCYEEAKSIRAPFEQAWLEAAKHAMPGHYQGFISTSGPMSTQGYGQAITRTRSYDSTGRRMLPRFIAVIDRLLTPVGQRYHSLKTSDESLNKSRRVKEFYEALNNELFAQRYRPTAHFVSANSETYASIGVFGNAAMCVKGKRKSPISRPGLSYRTLPLRDVFWLVNDEGDRDRVFLRWFWNARQIKTRFGEEGLPDVISTELKKQGGPSETRYFECVEIVCANYDDYQRGTLDTRRFPWLSRFLVPEARAYIGGVEGYLSCPYLLPRYFTEPGDVYATSPAIAATPAMGVASAMKRHMLKTEEKRADPAWLTHDPGIIVDTRAGAVMGGTLDREGRPLVRRMDEVTGSDPRGVKELLQDERSDIEDTFLGRLFNILEETREMTAREVAERVSKEFMLVAPTMGRMQEELLDPLVQREIDVIIEDPTLSRALPDVPPELLEAEGEYKVEYQSPMARAARMEDVQGFAQAVEFAVKIASEAQKPEVLDTFDFDKAMPEICDILNVPLGWRTKPEDLEAKRQEQAQAQTVDQAVQAAPAAAGLMQALTPGN